MWMRTQSSVTVPVWVAKARLARLSAMEKTSVSATMLFLSRCIKNLQCISLAEEGHAGNPAKRTQSALRARVSQTAPRSMAEYRLFFSLLRTTRSRDFRSGEVS